MNSTVDFLAELSWRGMLHQHTEGAPAALAAGPVAAYCGFDPTASSLHVGSLLPVMGLVQLQRAGHRPVALVGGGTGMIGDPSGKTEERQLASREVVEANARALRAQLERFLDFSGASAARMVDNAEWLLPLRTIDFLRDVGKHFSVNVMLAKESVRQRMETGISFTEFSYQLLQAYDFVELGRRYGVTLQAGGSDQWGNIVAGTDLMRRMDGRQGHGVTFPLLTTASGAKFGKSEGNAVWLDAERTSPFEFYQFWLRADDADVGRFLRFFTLKPREEIEALDAETAVHPERRAAQEALADDVTRRVHGAASVQTVREVSETLYRGRDPRSLSPAALAMLERAIPFAETTPAAPDAATSDAATPDANGGARRIDVFHLLVAVGLAGSNGEAKRLLAGGGVSVNGRALKPQDRFLTDAELLDGRRILLKKGKRDFALARVVA